jgi:hypothetical protein
MKFTAKNVGLLNGLQPVIGVAETGAKREYPDAFKVSLSAKSDGLVAEAHNGNVAITNVLSGQVNLDYTFGTAGTVTVSAKDLLNTLQSFEQDEVVDVELRGTELTFVPQSDAEKLQTIPSEVRQIEMPSLASTYTKETSINKSSLTEAANKVLFAIGFEKFRPEFLYWKLHVEPKKLRVVCGDGGRFPMYEIEGDNIVTASGATTFLIFKEHNPSLLKVLSAVEGETVTIKEFVKDGDGDTASDQFVVTLGTATVVLVGHDPGIKWPDESQFTARKNVYKFVTKAADWNKEMAGAWATYNEDVRSQNAVHVTVLNFDTKKGVVTLKTDNAMKAVRKVKLLDSQIEDGQADNIEFKCVTSVLRDAIKQAEGNIQMELLNGVKPMVVKYFAADNVSDGPLHRVNNAAGTKEQYVMAFGAYNKKK